MSFFSFLNRLKRTEGNQLSPPTDALALVVAGEVILHLPCSSLDGGLRRVAHRSHLQRLSLGHRVRSVHYLRPRVGAIVPIFCRNKIP